MDSTTHTRMTTGLPGLDHVLKGIIPGDNIVWQVESIEDYLAFVTPFTGAALRSGRPLVYFRFASHRPLIAPAPGIEIHELHPEEGFETFIATIHAVIEKTGREAAYVFDCLSELAGDWYSDQMLGNFFMLTCPYLYDLETVAYFALIRNHHSSHATGPISETTQLLLEVLNHKQALYVHPIKVQQRYSPTMNMLHLWKGNDFIPVTSSAVIADILGSKEWAGLGSDHIMDFSTRAIHDARDVLQASKKGHGQLEKRVAIFNQLCRMIISRDDKMLRLVSRHLTLEDTLEVAKRMIGTGLIGGKTVGMLLARAILKQAQPRFASLLEEHDSFYIGSDVFYTFLVRNGIWWTRQKQRHPESFLEGAEQARRRIQTGHFPAYILRQFEEMLDYFGQSPFIVRSSSLLEDNFGNSFAGKYESVFCANQGPRERRLEDFLAAVRTIYASTMSEKALRYRARRGLLDQDEQMALLVMRVSGSMHGRLFFPTVAGVGFSFNPYAWSEQIDPRAGVIRLVFGLGTRAVNRSDDDYTRVVALNAPSRRPESNFDEIRQYAQRKMDYLDLEANQLVSGYFVDVIPQCGPMPLDLFVSLDKEQERERRESRGAAAGPKPWVLTFDKLLSETPFVGDMQEMFRLLQAAYTVPVDIEFTANFTEDSAYNINLVQCRPLHVQGTDTAAPPAVKVRPEDRLIEARGAVIGQSRVKTIQRFIYVTPSLYGRLPLPKRYEVASLLGEINRATDSRAYETVMLLGPGRWGTSSPELGIPVSFADINRVAILCEIVAMRDDLIPDVSLGTHFLNELVEMDMLYLAIFPKQGDNYIHTRFFEEAPNRLLEAVPGAEKWTDVVRVIDAADITPKGSVVTISANALEQKVVCYLSRPA